MYYIGVEAHVGGWVHACSLASSVAAGWLWSLAVVVLESAGGNTGSRVLGGSRGAAVLSVGPATCDPI